MQEDKSQLMNYAMHGGLFLGLFWAMKYVLVLNVEQQPVLQPVVSFLSLGTPLFALYFLVKYKAIVGSVKLNFWHGMQFSIMLFFFASILEAVVVFVHVTWIDTAFIGKLYANMLETVKTLRLGDKMAASIQEQPLPSTVNYLISNVVLANVFIGILLSFVLVPLANRYNFKNLKSKQTDSNES